MSEAAVCEFKDNHFAHGLLAGIISAVIAYLLLNYANFLQRRVYPSMRAPSAFLFGSLISVLSILYMQKYGHSWFGQ